MVAKIKLIPYLLEINEFYIKKLGLNLDNLPEFIKEFLNQYKLNDEENGEYLACHDIIEESIQVKDETFKMIASLIHRGDFGTEKEIININSGEKTGKKVKDNETVPNNFYLFFMPIDDDKIYFMASKYKTWGIAEYTVQKFDKFIRTQYYKKENNCIKPLDEIFNMRIQRINGSMGKRKKKKREPRPIKLIKFTSIDIISQIKCIGEINFYRISKNYDLVDELVINKLPSNNNDKRPKYKLELVDRVILKIDEQESIKKIINRFKSIFGLNENSNPTYKEKDIEFIKLRTKLRTDEEKFIRISPDGIIFREDYIYKFKDPNSLEKVINELKNDELFKYSLNEALTKRQN